MKISIEEKKAEAIKRMKLLNIFPQTVKDFEIDDKVSISEPPFAAFYWADNFQKNLIRSIEKKHNILIYNVILTYTHFGKLLSFLYVSDYKEDWENDRQILKENMTVAYVYNYNVPDFSEAGCIGFKITKARGLLRTF